MPIILIATWCVVLALAIRFGLKLAEFPPIASVGWSPFAITMLCIMTTFVLVSVAFGKNRSHSGWLATAESIAASRVSPALRWAASVDLLTSVALIVAGVACFASQVRVNVHDPVPFAAGFLLWGGIVSLVVHFVAKRRRLGGDSAV